MFLGNVWNVTGLFMQSLLFNTKSMAFILELIFMIIAVWIDMKALKCFLNIRKEHWRQSIAYFACWIVTGNVLFIGDRVNLPLGLVIFVVGMYLGFEGSTIQKTAVSVMVGSMIMAYNVLADNWGEILFATVSFYVPGRILFAILFYLTAKYFGPEKDYELSPSMWRLLLLLSLTPLGIVTAVVMMTTPYWESLSGFWLHFVLCLIALFTFAGLLWTISVLAKQEKLERQMLFAEINKNYYEAMEQQQFEVRRLKHDLTNHLQTLSALSNEQRTAYIRELLDNEQVTKTLNYCGDATVNAVLTAKESVMRQQEIDFQWRIEIAEEIPIEKADVCAVFANALDNAVEACLGQNIPEKWIWLEGRVQKGMFALVVRNPVEEKGKGYASETVPHTTKKDIKNHGFGLKSIKEIAERHGGALEIQMEEGCFELFIYFPV